jgi:hypothetical protein
MITTSHEGISGMPDMMEDPCVRNAHHGPIDPHIQEEIHDVQTIDLTHANQHEEIESQIWETPSDEKIVETDRFMEHLLPGSAYSDEYALLISRDDPNMCLDTSIWDPGAGDNNGVSAQEDTTTHTRYDVIHMEITSSDGVQWHTGGPNSMIDSGQFNMLSYVEGVLGDSRVDTSSEGYEVAPQHDCDQ